jgi:hypothetical protein
LFLLLRKSNGKFLLASLKTLTNFKNSSSNPFQRACCGIHRSKQNLCIKYFLQQASQKVLKRWRESTVVVLQYRPLRELSM